MISVRKLTIAICLLFAAGSASADWTGGIEGGARIGSSDRPALRFYANNDADPLSHYAYVDWTRSSSGSNYRFGYNPTFRISHSVYSFGRFSLEEDDPGGIDRDVNALVGIGNNLFQRGNTRVKVEAGLGAQLLEFNDSTDETDGFLFLSGSLSSSILALVRFDAAITTNASGDLTEFAGEAGFSIPVAPGTQLRYVYEVSRFNFDDRENIVNEDSFFKVSYGF